MARQANGNRLFGRINGSYRLYRYQTGNRSERLRDPLVLDLHLTIQFSNS